MSHKMPLDQIIKTIEEKFTGRSWCPDDQICVYLSHTGKRCAIGLFIPAGHPGQWYDGSVVSLLTRYPDLRPLMPSNDLDDLRQFQKYHDDYLRSDIPLEQQKAALIAKAKELFHDHV